MIRAELNRAAEAAGWVIVTPYRLRHGYATSFNSRIKKSKDTSCSIKTRDSLGLWAGRGLGDEMPRSCTTWSRPFGLERLQCIAHRAGWPKPPRPDGGRIPGVSARPLITRRISSRMRRVRRPYPSFAQCLGGRPEASSIPADANPLTTRVSNLTVSRTGQGKTTDQRDPMSNQSPDLLAHSDGDAVAVGARDLSTGPVPVEDLESTQTEHVDLADAVPLGHKLALRDVAEGEPVIDYGLAVGAATTDTPAWRQGTHPQGQEFSAGKQARPERQSPTRRSGRRPIPRSHSSRRRVRRGRDLCPHNTAKQVSKVHLVKATLGSMTC